MGLEKPKGQKWGDVDREACIRRAQAEYRRLENERILELAEKIGEQCFCYGYLPEQVHLKRKGTIDLSELKHDDEPRDGISIHINWVPD